MIWIIHSWPCRNRAGRIPGAAIGGSRLWKWCLIRSPRDLDSIRSWSLPLLAVFSLVILVRHAFDKDVGVATSDSTSSRPSQTHRDQQRQAKINTDSRVGRDALGMYSVPRGQRRERCGRRSL
jgi:hypothetical protein